MISARGAFFGLLFLAGFAFSTEAERPSDQALRQKVRLYLQEGKTPEAAALLRGFLFYNPYHHPVKNFLKSQAPKPFTFWLDIPSDIVLLAGFCISVCLLFLFYKRRLKALKRTLPLTFALYTGMGFYFYHRHFVSYGTVTKTQPVLSAPTDHASVLFEVPALSLVRIRQIKAPFVQIHLKRGKTGWIKQGLVISIKPGPVKTKINAPPFFLKPF